MAGAAAAGMSSHDIGSPMGPKQLEPLNRISSQFLMNQTVQAPIMFNIDEGSSPDR
jgi:hypothetical protein